MPIKFETATDDVWVMGALIETGENGLASSFEQVMVPAEGLDRLAAPEAARSARAGSHHTM